jgi:cellulase
MLVIKIRRWFSTSTGDIADLFAGFKVFQDGMDSQRKWGVTRLVQNGGKFSFTIPSCIPAGQYLLRAELIALHGASNYPGAQLYMECAQLNIRGGGNKQPATVSFPGAYKPTDPGIKINVSCCEAVNPGNVSCSC